MPDKEVFTAIARAHTLIDYNDGNNKTIHKQQEFLLKTVLADESLTNNKKTEVVRSLNKEYDKDKILYNSGTTRICEHCNQECLATLYCKQCVRNHLVAKFSSWTSGNGDIDNLLQKCQMETQGPDGIVEWIPYSNLQNIKYLTKGGCSEIYTADWIGGRYHEWNSKEKRLKRELEFSSQKVALKKLTNVESANRSWFDEVFILNLNINLSQFSYLLLFYRANFI